MVLVTDKIKLYPIREVQTNEDDLKDIDLKDIIYSLSTIWRGTVLDGIDQFPYNFR